MPDPMNPADLWPMPSGAAPKPEPQRWVWAAMDPPERSSQLREFGVWVGRLRATFDLHNTLTHCWYRHPAAVEHLTAFYTGWIRTYTGEEAPGRELAEADWINTLYAFTPRLKLPACATGTHQEAPLTIPATHSAAAASPTAKPTSTPRCSPAAGGEGHDDPHTCAWPVGTLY